MVVVVVVVLAMVAVVRFVVAAAVALVRVAAGVRFAHSVIAVTGVIALVAGFFII